MYHNPNFLDVFLAVLPLFCVAFLGVLFRKHRKMDAHADATLLWLVINLFTPCLIIDSFLGSPSLLNLGEVAIAPVLGFLTALVGVVLGWVGAHLLRFQKEEQKRAFIACVSMYNYGYIPIPIIMFFFDKDTLRTLFVFNLGMELALWTLGVLILAGTLSWKSAIQHILKPPLIAIVFSILVKDWVSAEQLPGNVWRVIHMVGQGTIPMALLLVGATIIDHAPNMSFVRPFRSLFAGCLLRLVVIPACFVVMAVFLPLPLSIKTVLCVQAGMPSAVLPIVLAKHYGGDVHLSIRIVVGTSVLSLFTLPAWLSFSLPFFH